MNISEDSLMTSTLCDSKGCEHLHSHLKAVCVFITHYTTALVACGATTKRVTANVLRMAHNFDTEVDVTILTGHVMITVRDCDDSHSYTLTRRIPASPIDFALNAMLSRLSWRIADKHLSLSDACKLLDCILHRKRLDIRWVTFLASVANASFCRLFGGDWQSMLVVFLSTAIAFKLKLLLTSHCKVNIYAATFVSATIAALLSCSALLFGWGDTGQTALATSVLFLVPGVPFINGLSDMMTGHYTCGLGRLTRAVMLTVCLTGGLMVAMLCMNIDML